MKTIFALVFQFIFLSTVVAQQITVSGTITDAKTGESLIGVSVACLEELKGTMTNEFGFYSLDVKTNCSLTITYIGYEKQTLAINSKTLLTLDIALAEKQNQLKEVTINANSKSSPLEKTATGFTKLDLKQISTVPVLGGEKDVIKILQLMPGVKKENDGNTGMLVRGGSGDQNLVLLDDAPVYNASHLLGFFSVFNSDAIKDVSLQKGGFTSNFGGRLSSVLDIRMKDGNMKETEVNAGIGILSARGSIEGPIIKDKMSYIISARRTYVEQIYQLIGSNMPLYFYDVNAKLNYRISEKDQVFLSAYRGKDVLRFGNAESKSAYQADFANRLGNQTFTARWNHVYPDQKLFQHVSLIYTKFNYQLTNRINTNEMQITSSIQDFIAKANYDYYLNNRNHIQFGCEITQHHFNPNKVTTKGSFNESIKPSAGNRIYMKEGAVYANNNHYLTARWNANYGVRISGALANTKNYTNIEPRVNIAYHISSSQTIKAAYSHMSQYVNLVTGASTLPSDVWYPATDIIKPQLSKQITLGYSNTLRESLVFSAETYYKWQQNVVEFKEGTVGFTNENIEQDIAQGNAKTYGVELLLHQKSGKWNGWIGYTLAYSKRQFAELNNGEEFYARFDRRHDISLVGNYELTKRLTLSAVYCFATGSRFTPVVGQYFVPNGSYTDVTTLPIYGKRNSVLLSPAHRLDVNVVIKSEEGKKYNSELHIGAYNVYNQTQPYRIRLDVNENGSLSYKEVGLFGFIPSLAYNIKF